MTKKCTRCKNDKAAEEFAKQSRGKDGLSSWCKKCFAENAAAKYQSSEEERKRKKRNVTRMLSGNRDKLITYLEEHPCVDCKTTDVRVLEFDHRDPSEKECNISEMVWWRSWDAVLIEINKCDVRCANCHRIKTSEQFGSWRSKLPSPGLAQLNASVAELA